EILLSPAEFDALATVTKKLLKMSGAPIEQIVIDELKKAYVRKETNYMFNGDDTGNENPGALAKKAVAYYESTTIDPAAVDSQKLYQELVKLKGQPVTEVLKKSMWIINRAALTVLEGMTDTTGKPLLHEVSDGVGYKLLGHKVDFTDAADGADPTAPVFYFGDFKTFHIQDVIGGMELQKLIEKFSGTNKVGFQIYNLLDGQLVYSPFEPSVYRYEVGAVDPSTTTTTA
ncbi:MAG: phage major capsid protein, partial [Bacillus sp. (in: firmicutes)]